MKFQSPLSSAPLQEPGEDQVREYAYHLYEQGQCAPGHAIDNWLEAIACLKAHIPAHSSHRRLHQHVNGPSIRNQQPTSALDAERLIVAARG